MMSLTPWEIQTFFVQEWQCAWADGQVQLEGTLPTCEPQVEPAASGQLLTLSWRNPMRYSYIMLYHYILH